MTDSSYGGHVDDPKLQTKLAYWDIFAGDGRFSLTLTEGTPNLITTLGAGTPAIAHDGVAASEQAVLAMDTADEAYGRTTLPWYIDPAYDLHAQLAFQVDEASKSDIDWALWVKRLAAGGESSDAKVSSDGNVAFVAASNTDLGEYVVTERKALDVAGLFTDPTDLMQFAVELDDNGDASADKVGLIFVRFYGTAGLMSSLGVRQAT